jgi:hypothetical protein
MPGSDLGDRITGGSSSAPPLVGTKDSGAAEMLETNVRRDVQEDALWAEPHKDKPTAAKLSLLNVL